MSIRAYNILVASLGGEGGGVLADWIVTAATIAGYPIQSTSIPGVAQRTGATTYYLELFPQKVADLRGARPILALTPTPGDVDVVIASELVEAGRAIQNGYVTPARTTLIASTSRVYAIAERSNMADGRFDSDRIVTAAHELAHRALLFDGSALARESGCQINAILFGALIASQALPFDQVTAEQAIRKAGKVIDSNLRGLALGFERAIKKPAPLQAVVSKPVEISTSVVADFPQPPREVIAHGAERLYDYQGNTYVRLYLDRLQPIAQLESAAGGDFTLTRETARFLALWMSYEDVIRVADLKTCTDRRKRIHREVRATDSDIVRVTEFLKPGLEELFSVLPSALGDSLYRMVVRRGWGHRLNIGMHIRSTNVSGFLLLRLLATLRWWRPYSWRYQQEQARIEKWLFAIKHAASRDLALANEIAACGQIMKGYGDTHSRAQRNFDLIADAYFDNRSVDVVSLRRTIRAARDAALADPEGDALDAVIAKSPQQFSAAAK